MRAVEVVGCGGLQVWWFFSCILGLLCVCGHLRRKTSVRLAVKCHVKSSLSISPPCYNQSSPKIWRNHLSVDIFSPVFGPTAHSGPRHPHLHFCRSYSATHHSRQVFLGRVISSSQTTLPDNKQHTQQTDIHAPSCVRTHNHVRRAAANLKLEVSGNIICLRD